jgi:hypothetical protein
MQPLDPDFERKVRDSFLRQDFMQLCAGRPRGLRRQHPLGENVVLAHDVEHRFARRYGNLVARFEPLKPFAASLA